MPIDSRGQTFANVEDFIASLGPHKRWYRFGWESPAILYKRLRHQYTPILDIKSGWQRARRGWSVRDTWGLHWYLENIIIGAIEHWRAQPPMGHPAGMSYEQWLQVLDEIVEGMKAVHRCADNWEWEEGGEERFNLAMNHLKTHWLDLWD